MDSRTPNSVKPALGLTWADIVTMRLMLSRPEGVDSTEEHSKVWTGPYYIFECYQANIPIATHHDDPENPSDIIGTSSSTVYSAVLHRL